METLFRQAFSGSSLRKNFFLTDYAVPSSRNFLHPKSYLWCRKLAVIINDKGRQQMIEELSDGILVLSGLYPGGVHTQLIMRDFNQDVVVAHVAKPPGEPRPGLMLPVIVQSQSLSETDKSRIHRRHQQGQLTSFLLGSQVFEGKILQIDYHQSAVCDRADSVEVMSFVIQCIDVSRDNKIAASADSENK
jgi:hypothetical protein